MFQLEWADKKTWAAEPAIASGPSRVDKKSIVRTIMVNWEEHCVECAAPDCYSTCTLYRRRADGECKRFLYGIYPNKDFRGRYHFGADVRFRKWGKIEANLRLSSPMPLIPYYWVTLFKAMPDAVQMWVQRVLDKVYGAVKYDFDEFIMECYSASRESYKLVLEYFTETNGVRSIKFKHSFTIQEGYNFHSISREAFGVKTMDGYLYLSPEDSNSEKRLVFTWLDFVKYKEGFKRNSPAQEIKIKCLAWDLDNTLWDGILEEGRPVTPNREAIELIKKMDEKGIVQTVISKNDFGPAWGELEKIGLEKYFLYPAINWGQKSENLSEIAKKLNIDLNTFAVIDDSPFERAEIRKALPQVRVYTEKEIVNIGGYREFQVPVTDTARNRRASYQVQMERDKIKANFSGSYHDFLASCHMRAEVFVPAREGEVLRCWELIQRSNQLNLSSNRYPADAFGELLANKQVLSLAIKCHDKFGDYGIVGFASIDLSTDVAVLTDFVLSCRVAQKMVEHTFIKCLSGYLYGQGFARLDVKLLQTEKNKPLRKVFSDLPFTTVSQEGDKVLLTLDVTSELPLPPVVEMRLDESVPNPLILQ
jgi:FkbH-like protein